jgi:amino acid transporter
MEITGMGLTWRRVVVLALGSALLVNVSLGPMAAEIGAASILVWPFAAFVGLVQSLLLGELGSRYPDSVGGTPSYVHAGLQHLSPLWGGLAAWAYWIAWIPGVAVHVVLAAAYARAAFWPDANFALLIGAALTLLYTVNYFGPAVLFWVSSVMAACALGPLLLILANSPVHAVAWRALFEGLSLSGGGFQTSTVLVLAKWMFVATWSAYAAEMAAALVGAMRTPARDVQKVLGCVGVVTFLSFTLVPIALVANVGAETLGADPYLVFLTAARGMFGASGTAVVSTMLVAALLSSAQLFIISSSRVLCQMSRDHLMPPVFGKVNRYGVPVGSVGWDAVVTLTLLAIFRENVVHLVAAANVGYLMVFVLLPISYVLVRKREKPPDGVRPLPSFMTGAAHVVLVVNVLLLVVGGAQWGGVVMGVGVLLVAAGVPVVVYSRRAAEARPAIVGLRHLPAPKNTLANAERP